MRYAVSAACAAGFATTVLRDQRGRDLSREDRDWKVPGADAGEHAAAVQRQHVALAGRAGQRRRAAEALARLLRVVAAEIHRLAHVRHGIGQGFPASQTHRAIRPARSASSRSASRSRAAARSGALTADQAARAACRAVDCRPRDVRRRFAHLADGQVGPGGDTPAARDPAGARLSREIRRSMCAALRSPISPMRRAWRNPRGRSPLQCAVAACAARW